MPTGKPRPDSPPSLMEQLLAHTLDPLGVVMLTRERIQETLEEAVQRGRVTRTDANDLAGELLRRGRQQTEELLSRDGAGARQWPRAGAERHREALTPDRGRQPPRPHRRGAPGAP